MNRHERRAAAAAGIPLEKEDINALRTDAARARLASSCLSRLMRAAKLQMNVINWRRVGGLELEDFANALACGGPHPLLLQWERDKGLTKHPAPGLREAHARRLAVLLCLALRQANINKAREWAAKALAEANVFATPPSDTALKHWEQRLEPPLAPEDEQVLATALARCGRDPKALGRYFAGLIRFARDPFLQIIGGPNTPTFLGL
jgi:hypothetical protein